MNGLKRENRPRRTGAIFAILNHLDDHPEDYSEYFVHKNELSPEDYSWMCINEGEEKRYGFNDKHC